MTYKVDPRHPEQISTPPYGLALTGRVADWLQSPEGRLPVSCTVMDVQDSMEGHEGIEYGWLFTSHGLRNGAGVALNLNNLRERGHENGKGLTASGAVSFLKIFNVINEVLRRGGLFKNGAITVYLDYDNPDLPLFLTLNTKEYNWIKRAIYIDDGIWDSPYLDQILEAVDKGYVWLAKKQYDKEGNRLFSNVCLEILLKSRGSCLISNVNMGLATIKTLKDIMVNSMDYLCTLHRYTSVERTKYYLSQDEDRQVGLGFIGLSNFLAINNIKYAEFIESLEKIEDYTRGFKPARVKELEEDYVFTQNSTTSDDAALELVKGFIESAKVARKNNMERAFTVAPTASSFTRHYDLDGYSVSPEISPPIGLEIERASETFGTLEFEFNPEAEIAFDVGWDNQWKLVNIWQRLMDSTGLGHSISTNIWSTKKVDKTFLSEFMNGAVKTTYYRMAVNQYSNDKSSIVSDETLEKMASVYSIETGNLEGTDTKKLELSIDFPMDSDMLGELFGAKAEVVVVDENAYEFKGMAAVDEETGEITYYENGMIVDPNTGVEIDPSCGCPIDPVERESCSSCDGS